MASTLNQGPGPTIAHVHPAYQRNPLEIPELLTLVGQHMDNRTLCTSIRVSHLWNSSFLPILWSVIRVHGLSRVEFDAVKANAKYICDLRLLDDVDLRYGTDLFCPNLTHLSIECFLVIDCYFATPLYAFGNLIRRHRHTLKSIRFAQPTDEALWSALEECTQLEDLTILELRLTYPGEWLSLYDRIWSRLTVLHLAGDWTPIEIPKDLLLQPTNDSRPLAKIQDLTIARDDFVPDEQQRYNQTQAQGWIVQQCQSLVQCDWKTGGYDQEMGPVHQLSKGLQTSGQTLWPHLESLLLAQEYRTSDFAIVVDGLTRLTELQMHSTNFDEFCWHAIQRNSRHMASLRKLVLIDCALVTGNILQEMMASLPNLEHLEAKMIKDSDIVDDGREWICLRLKILRLIISLETQASQPMILERISRLVHLEDCRMHGVAGCRVPLQLTLQGGLDQLRTLRQMQRFQVGPLQQGVEWGQAEVQWTKDHWPRLKGLFGVNVPPVPSRSVI